MEQIKLGIVGVGHLGSVHARLASSIPAIDLVGVYDIDQSRCLDVASSCSSRAFDALPELLREADAVCIVAPTEHHFQLGREALQAGCHLFIEKPITSRTDQARELLELADRAGKIIQVGHIERFNPAFRGLRGQTIAPLFIETHRLSTFNPRGTDVSVILDLMIHDLDIILSLMKHTVSSIHACGVRVVSEAEDIANVRLEFENQAVANLTASRISTKDMRKMRIFQTNAYISVDFLNKKTEIFSLEDAPGIHPQNPIPIGDIGAGDRARKVLMHQPPFEEINALETELQEFAHAVATGAPPPVSGQEGLRALEVAEIILSQIKRP
jgi:predicted dehydrogenase